MGQVCNLEKKVTRVYLSLQRRPIGPIDQGPSQWLSATRKKMYETKNDTSWTFLWPSQGRMWPKFTIEFSLLATGF